VVLERALGSKPAWSVRVVPYLIRISDKLADKQISTLLVNLPDESGAYAFPSDGAEKLISSDDPGIRVARLWPVDLFDGQSGQVHEGATATYLRDYEADDDSKGAEPLVGRMREGAAISFTPRRDGQGVEVEARFRCGLLKRPLETYKTELVGSGRHVVIQLPEMRLIDVRGKVAIPLGGWVLVGSDKAIDDGAVLFTLLHVGAPR
jgi:hypothetical protein